MIQYAVVTCPKCSGSGQHTLQRTPMPCNGCAGQRVIQLAYDVSKVTTYDKDMKVVS